eukprot:TRINITY_DN14790_c0_g1_i1.p2 TRINITY_DN14790_c0_g1~~TRINITY_DN14790_c0_g1_i1.p2  ORF type:complete len:180 (-),score=19.45 TRINITY_DN14790_c0_g1_i1:148-687(-)
MLKVTKDKGASVLQQLAGQLPTCNFIAVTAYTKPELGITADNVRLYPPNEQDIEAFLKLIRILIVPSMWMETFGMVVVEGMLRGVPVVVSNVGGLPEAALSAAIVLPLVSVKLNNNDWQQRQFPLQSEEILNAWKSAIVELISNKERFQDQSENQKLSALKFCSSRHQELGRFLDWLKQ